MSNQVASELGRGTIVVSPTCNLRVHNHCGTMNPLMESSPASQERAPAVQPEKNLFWIYNSLTGRYVAIHRAQCGFCNSGKGVGGGYNRLFAIWRGPFRTLDEAAQHVFALPETVQEMRFCRRCL